MTTPNILTDTSPLIDPDRLTVARSVITDAWGLYFAQGGVVMAAALRAMGLVLERDDLALASASATFIDSTCTNVGNSLASGVLHLWSESGTHVATVTQTAMLRSLV